MVEKPGWPPLADCLEHFCLEVVDKHLHRPKSKCHCLSRLLACLHCCHSIGPCHGRPLFGFQWTALSLCPEQPPSVQLFFALLQRHRPCNQHFFCYQSFYPKTCRPKKLYDSKNLYHSSSHCHFCVCDRLSNCHPNLFFGLLSQSFLELAQSETSRDLQLSPLLSWFLAIQFWRPLSLRSRESPR